MKLSQATKGKNYRVESLGKIGSLSRRMALLGINSGTLLELTELYHHGALVKTYVGDVAIGRDLLDLIHVTSA